MSDSISTSMTNIERLVTYKAQQLDYSKACQHSVAQSPSPAIQNGKAPFVFIRLTILPVRISNTAS